MCRYVFEADSNGSPLTARLARNFSVVHGSAKLAARLASEEVARRSRRGTGARTFLSARPKSAAVPRVVRRLRPLRAAEPFDQTMSTHSEPQPALRIQTPCPKRWDELAGGGARRFCSQCSLHVHDAAQLTRDEATALVANASERVCMRLTYAPDGRALFRDDAGAATRPVVAPWRRAAAWLATAAAGALAACTRNANQPVTPPHSAPTPPPVTTQKLGEVSVEAMGDVAVEEKLGKVAGSHQPPAPPASPAVER